MLVCYLSNVIAKYSCSACRTGRLQVWSRMMVYGKESQKKHTYQEMMVYGKESQKPRPTYQETQFLLDSLMRGRHRGMGKVIGINQAWPGILRHPPSVGLKSLGWRIVSLCHNAAHEVVTGGVEVWSKARRGCTGQSRCLFTPTLLAVPPLGESHQKAGCISAMALQFPQQRRKRMELRRQIEDDQHHPTT